MAVTSTAAYSPVEARTTDATAQSAVIWAFVAGKEFQAFVKSCPGIAVVQEDGETGGLVEAYYGEG